MAHELSLEEFVRRSPLERDPFVDAAHVRDGIHTPRPLSRETPILTERLTPTSVRTLELGAVGLDASAQTKEL